MRRESIVAALAATLCLVAVADVAKGLEPRHDEIVLEGTCLQEVNACVSSEQESPVDQIQLARRAITASEAVRAVQERFPGGIVLTVRELPNGDFIITIRIGNQVRRVRVNGQTSQIR